MPEHGHLREVTCWLYSILVRATIEKVVRSPGDGGEGTETAGGLPPHSWYAQIATDGTASDAHWL